MPSPALTRAVAAVPPGGYAVGVSGGADSVALLLLLRRRSDLVLEVVHLNHETRGDASDADATFVAQLATGLGLRAALARWGDVKPMLTGAPRNRSARFRAGRMALFRHVVTTDRLDGVILAHHADDVAETVLQRLLRGGPVTGLAALRPRTTINGLVVLRPLLSVRRAELRQFLFDQNQPWREDESNASPRYQRNRLRRLLAARPDLTEPLLELGAVAAEVKDWLRRTAPRAGEQLATTLLQDLPEPLALETARRWLQGRGVPPGELTSAVLHRLVTMATDAATPPRQHFPGKTLVRRRGGMLWVEESGEAPMTNK